jgi:hypothetical protein
MLTLVGAGEVVGQCWTTVCIKLPSMILI